MANFGFVDMRTQAELLLSPKLPASRDAVNVGTLKLNLGGTPGPGVISDPTQLSGPVRSVFGTVLANKASLKSLSDSLTSVLSSFDTKQVALQNGTFVPPDPLLTPVLPAGALPNVDAYFTFSSLNPGQVPPASFDNIIEQRKEQLQSLAKSSSSVYTSSDVGGAVLTENTQPDNYPLPDQIDLPTTPRLAQGGSVAQNDPILQDKAKFNIHGVPIGSGKPNSWSRLVSDDAVASSTTLNPVVNQIFTDRTHQSTWSEPPSPFSAQFPYNKVQQSESGHVIEIDDTPGAERVHIFHRAGSFIEFHPNGTVVYKNVKDGYDLTLGNKYVKVNGKCHVAVDGGATFYCKGNIDVQSEGDINVQAKGDYNVYAANINLRAKKTFRGDGTLIDLRYIKLPSSLLPVFAGFTPVGWCPSINMTAVTSDFPDFSPTFPTPSLQGTAGALSAMPIAASVIIPPINPLSNWSIYQAQTPEAVTYRAQLFDTPEEVNDFEKYGAHQGLQQALGDIPAGTAASLGGTLSTTDTGLVAPDVKPTVNYLNFDDYKGNYVYANNYVLGNTSFSLSDVSDLALHPDVASDILSEPDLEDSPDDTTNGGATAPVAPVLDDSSTSLNPQTP